MVGGLNASTNTNAAANACDVSRSAEVRARVEAARERQRRRYRGPDGAPVVHCNAQLSPRQLREVCALDPEGQALLERAIERLGLSARPTPAS